MLYYVALYGILLCCMVLCYVARYCIAFYGIVLYCTVLCCKVLCCVVKNCIIFCNVNKCFAFNYIYSYCALLHKLFRTLFYNIKLSYNVFYLKILYDIRWHLASLLHNTLYYIPLTCPNLLRIPHTSALNS